MPKSKRARACDISAKVKKEVWERDNHCCIICGSHHAAPNSHYIKRSQMGLGIPENIGTMCLPCHIAYDQKEDQDVKKVFREYLQSRHDGWDESKLTYEKYRWTL